MAGPQTLSTSSSNYAMYIYAEGCERKARGNRQEAGALEVRSEPVLAGLVARRGPCEIGAWIHGQVQNARP